jgi:hypothetical protein
VQLLARKRAPRAARPIPCAPPDPPGPRAGVPLSGLFDTYTGQGSPCRVFGLELAMAMVIGEGVAQRTQACALKNARMAW